MRRVIIRLCLVGAMAGLTGGGCRQSTPMTSVATKPTGLYTDVAQSAGIDFRHENGATGEHYILETIGSGCAFFDYDADGRPDLLLLQAGSLPWVRTPASAPRNRLYHNRGDGTFQDVTMGSGLEDTGYSQGVAVGDVNRDGFDDLFVTNYGPNRLLLNQKGSGAFRDVTGESGMSQPDKSERWSTSAAFGDYDRDGDLDLFVCRYARWSHALNRPCKNPLGALSYCSPELYAGDTSALYRNDGRGKFTEVSGLAGIGATATRALGVAWLDFDHDGWEDIFVANDLNPYTLWRNRGDGTFRNVAVPAGVAYSDLGQVLSGMGVAVRDFNGDEREDLFVTNFSGQMNALFRNEGAGSFTNVTHPSGIGAASFNLLAFGCEFLDYDRDAHPDLVVGNGHIYEDIDAYSEGVAYQEPKSLLRNAGDGRFVPVMEGIGDLAVPRVTRGLATADYDGDGHLDLVASNQDGAVQLLRYTGPSSGHWLSISTRGVRSNPNGYHARVRIRIGSNWRFAEARSGSSYCSSSDPAVYFGLGAATTVDEVEIRWHGSSVITRAKDLAADQAYRAVEGQPIVPRSSPRGERAAPK